MSDKPNLPKNAGAVDWAGPDCKEGATSGLIHCIRLPDEASESDPVPLIVLLHGWGGNESSMWVFKQIIPPGVAAVSPRAPLELDDRSYAWFYRDDPLHLTEPESLLDSMDKVETFITSMPRLYPVDADRMLLVGFSQGAAVGNSLVMARPESMVGVALLSGMGFQLPGLIPQVMSLHDFPVFIAHGTRDEVVPLSAAQEARQMYQDLGANVTYGEYNVGHKMHTQAVKDLRGWVNEILGIT